SAVRGMELAIEEINAGKELGPHSLKLVIEDDGSVNNQTITLLNKFATSGRALAIAGPSGSAPSLAASPAANQNQIPMLAIAVTPAVNAAGPWSNRIISLPSTIVDGLTDYVLARVKPKTVMTVGARDNDGAAAMPVIMRKLLQGKVTLLPEESALMADTDFTALATKIASQKPSMVFISMNDAGAANIILQSRQAGVGNEVQFVSTNAAASATFLKIGGKAVEGTIMATDAAPHLRTDKLAQNYMANFQKKFGAEPDQWSSVGYTIIRVYGRVIAGIKGPVTRQAVRDGIAATKNMPVVLGDGKTNLSFDEARNPIYKPMVLVAKDGKLIAAP
ncbi:MAG: amino acid ABC transporter substrate-binding protein, partial [Betaproteobacteria bacterium]|nr:amino acid ABC transporter substrate-binding protein [Betaproteobacteria bacterium]